jgi:hypothetical protein
MITKIKIHNSLLVNMAVVGGAGDGCNPLARMNGFSAS